MRNPSFSRFGFDGTLYHEGAITVYGIRGYAHVPMQGGAWFLYVHSGIAQARGDMVLTAGMYGVVNWGNVVVLENSEVLLIHNPNSVAPPELELLSISIREDGWTQPIVVNPDMTIVDGFHRWTVSGQIEVYKLTGGYVPVVVIEPPDVSSQMISTVRHNRARAY